ncbi:MAG: hypothetical protein QNJ00_10845 [Woeseiaceae bacterium]|nr:hypothetical protein [Woeseiaceae bacterium]
MPPITLLHIGIATGAILLGIIVGWVMRASRCNQEKAAINLGWQEQLEARNVESSRLQNQNKNLMEQVSQYQASGKDATNRARELSSALKEAFERRDELQRQIKDIRSNLEAVIAERRKLENDMQALSDSDTSLTAALEKKDEKIAKLSRELEGWQNRLPPLMDKFREKNESARELEAELDEARARIAELEDSANSEPAEVDAIEADTLGTGLEASNDTLEAIETFGDDDDEQHEVDDSDVEEAYAAEDERPGGLRDNLKRIKGVGPAIEKTLNELGIFRFGQIAEMSEYDIDRVAKRLKGFRSRIYREDWIGQARELLEETTGESA